VLRADDSRGEAPNDHVAARRVKIGEAALTDSTVFRLAPGSWGRVVRDTRRSSSWSPSPLLAQRSPHHPSSSTPRT